MNDICENNHGGNPLSVAANLRTNKQRNEERILAYLGTIPDATCDEAELALSMSHQTCSSRFSDLKAAGLLVPTVRRNTRTGSTAQAWKTNTTAQTYERNI